MKHSLKLTSLVALLTVAAVPSWAQTQTNLVQELQIRLVGLSQGGTTTNHNTVTESAGMATISTRDIVNAIGTAAGDTFSPAARLFLNTPLGGGSPTVTVNDGTNEPVDVSRFFVFTTLGNAVDTSVTNNRTDRESGNSYVLENFVLQDADVALSIHFNVTGIATSSFTDSKGNLLEDRTSASVTGSGDKNGVSLILSGQVSVHGTTLQVTDPAPPPNV